MEKTVLQRLKEERVFTLIVLKDSVDFVDGCDGAFGLILYKKDLANLIKELQYIHDNQIISNGK